VRHGRRVAVETGDGEADFSEHWLLFAGKALLSSGFFISSKVSSRSQSGHLTFQRAQTQLVTSVALGVQKCILSYECLSTKFTLRDSR
jgi:hypothetical protein